MSDRTFTLDEAQSLLPVLESLLRTAMAGKKLMEEVDAEMQEVGHRIFLNGGTHLNIVPLARRKAERTKAEQRVRDAFAEIDSIGVQVKDLDIGVEVIYVRNSDEHRHFDPNRGYPFLTSGDSEWLSRLKISRAF